MRIADYIRPTRIVGQVNGQTVTDAIRQPVSTYVRPYARNGSNLEVLTEALDKWSPQFHAYAVKARDAQFKKDVAEGMALMENLAAQGHDPLDMRMPEIRELVKNGHAGKLAALNRAHEHGINIVQMDTAAKGLQGYMDDWFKNAMVEKDGVQYHVYEINDPMEFERAFTLEAAKRFNEITGGQYDAALYEKYYLPKLNEARQNTEKQYIAQKAKIKKLKTNQVFSANLNNGIVQKLKNGAYLKDPAFADKFAQELNTVYEAVTQLTDEENAAELLRDYVSNLMINGTESQINVVESAINKTMLAVNPDKMQSIAQKAQQQRFYWERKRDLAERKLERLEAKRDRARQAHLLGTLIMQGITADRNSVINAISANPQDARIVMSAVSFNEKYNEKERQQTLEQVNTGTCPPDKINDLPITPEQKAKLKKEYNKNMKGITKESTDVPIIKQALENAGLIKKSNSFIRSFEPVDSVSLSYFNTAYNLAEAEEITRIGLDKFQDNPVQAQAELDRWRQSFVSTAEDLRTQTGIADKATFGIGKVREIVERQRLKMFPNKTQPIDYLKALNNGDMAKLLENRRLNPVVLSMSNILATNEEAFKLSFDDLYAQDTAFRQDIEQAQKALLNNSAPVIINGERINTLERLFEILKYSTMAVEKGK